MLGFPQMYEQTAVAYRLQQTGNGDVFRKGGTPEELLQTTLKLLEPEAQEKTTWMRKVMEFEEVRGQQGMQHWIRYVARFG